MRAVEAKMPAKTKRAAKTKAKTATKTKPKTKRARKQVGLSRAVLEARVSRWLSRNSLLLCKNLGGTETFDVLGPYFIVEWPSHRIVHDHVDLERMDEEKWGYAGQPK
jgi:hypothetical protein